MKVERKVEVKEIRKNIDETNADSSSRVSVRVLFAMRGGQKAFSILPRTVFFSYCRSFSVTHTLSYFLYEVRGVRVARKINNYEARGDDSNGEIKVSQSKVILRILCYSHFVFVFALLRNYSLDHGNVAMIVKTGSTRGNLHLLHALKHVPFRILCYKSEFTFPYTRCSYKITFSPFFQNLLF